ncbi:MAG: hypothetical protein IPI88_19220 [Chitinophagaceae bacterium]|nr:hypothetical protein [Chitinophagaceae bacterium]
MMSETVKNKVYLATGSTVLVYEFDDKGNTSLVLEKPFPFEFRIFCKQGKRFSLLHLMELLICWIRTR